MICVIEFADWRQVLHYNTLRNCSCFMVRHILNHIFKDFFFVLKIIIIRACYLADYLCLTSSSNLCGKDGNVLFNDALGTFYLRLYFVGRMVKDHSDSEIGNLLPSHGLLFPINSKHKLFNH